MKIPKVNRLSIMTNKIPI